jgi:hypothetical protein
MTTCLRKLDFDIDQLKYFTSRRNFPANLTNYLAMFQHIRDDLQKKKLPNNELVKLDTTIEHRYVVGRALHVIDGGMTTNPLYNNEALKQIQKASQQMTQSDFIVIDMVMDPTALSISNTFLSSRTIWFDNTNGQAYASFYDDGLVLPQFQSMAKVAFYRFADQISSITMLIPVRHCRN